MAVHLVLGPYITCPQQAGHGLDPIGVVTAAHCKFFALRGCRAVGMDCSALLLLKVRTKGQQGMGGVATCGHSELVIWTSASEAGAALL